jgi:hypothetical protein
MKEPPGPEDTFLGTAQPERDPIDVELENLRKWKRDRARLFAEEKHAEGQDAPPRDPPHILHWVPRSLYEATRKQRDEAQAALRDRTATADPMRMTYKALSDAEVRQMNTIKEHAKTFYDFIDDFGPSREISLAKTKIEEAVMWAVKYITR